MLRSLAAFKQGKQIQGSLLSSLCRSSRRPTVKCLLTSSAPQHHQQPERQDRQQQSGMMSQPRRNVMCTCKSISRHRQEVLCCRAAVSVTSHVILSFAKAVTPVCAYPLSAGAEHAYEELSLRSCCYVSGCFWFCLLHAQAYVACSHWEEAIFMLAPPGDK